MPTTTPRPSRGSNERPLQNFLSTTLLPIAARKARVRARRSGNILCQGGAQVAVVSCSLLGGSEKPIANFHGEPQRGESMKRLRNSTTVSGEVVKRIEAFVMPPGGVGAYDLELRNSGGNTCGRAYWAGSAYHTTARPFIVVRLSRRERAPAYTPHRAGYLPTPARGSRVEQLVYLMAHELRHLWQARVKRGRRVWGARGQFSERDADAYAIGCLRRWRREAGSGVC